MDKQELLKRFQSPDDKLCFSKVLDRLFLCQSACDKAFTVFIDPVRAAEFTEILRSAADEAILAYGGAAGCERKMLGFAPVSRQLEYDDFPIDRLAIRFLKKFGSKLSHRDFLGAITGLGINREKIGDINVSEGEAEAFVSRDVSGFICVGLEHAGRVKVTAAIENTKKAFWEEWPEMSHGGGIEMTVRINSLRIDAVISAVFNLSRGNSAKLINSGKVSVNWTPVTRAEKAVIEGSVITARGYGRIRIETIDTKKERYAVRLYKYS